MKEKINELIRQLQNKAKPSFENGIFNKDNANYNTGLSEGIDALLELLEEVE